MTSDRSVRRRPALFRADGADRADPPVSPRQARPASGCPRRRKRRPANRRAPVRRRATQAATAFARCAPSARRATPRCIFPSPPSRPSKRRTASGCIRYLRVMDFIAGSWRTATPDEVIEDSLAGGPLDGLGRFPWAVAQVDRAVSGGRRAAHVGFAALPARPCPAVAAESARCSRAREEDSGSRHRPRHRQTALGSAPGGAGLQRESGITADEGPQAGRGLPAPGQAGAECGFRAPRRRCRARAVQLPIHLPTGTSCGAGVRQRGGCSSRARLRPHAAEVYAKCLEEARRSPRRVQTSCKEAGAAPALSAHPGVDAVLFTGSWGRRPGHPASEIRGRRSCWRWRWAARTQPWSSPTLTWKAAYDVLFSAFVSAVSAAPPRPGPWWWVTPAVRARIAQLAQQLSIGHRSTKACSWGRSRPPRRWRNSSRGYARPTRSASSLRTGYGRRARRVLRQPSVHFVHQRRGTAYERGRALRPRPRRLPRRIRGRGRWRSPIHGLRSRGERAHPQRANLRSLPAGARLRVVNWNAPTVGASGRSRSRAAPQRQSSSGRALETLYCAAPVAVMRGDLALDRKKLAPGVSWVDE